MHTANPEAIPTRTGRQATEMATCSGRNSCSIRGTVNCVAIPRTAPAPAPTSPMAAVWQR